MSTITSAITTMTIAKSTITFLHSKFTTDFIHQNPNEPLLLDDKPAVMTGCALSLHNTRLYSLYYCCVASDPGNLDAQHSGLHGTMRNQRSLCPVQLDFV